MKNFSYRARNLSGKIVDGSIRADTQTDVLSMLERDGLVPVEIKEATQKVSRIKHVLPFIRPVPVTDIIVFTRQFSTMLKAGVPILQALRALKAQTSNPVLSDTIESIALSITDGASLSDAMKEHPDVFTPQYVSVVVSGESGADLVQALLRMADWLEREEEVKKEIISFLRYPVIVLLSLIGAAGVIIGFVIPKFSMFYSRANVQLPLPTRILVHCADFVRIHLATIFVIFLLLLAIPLIVKIPGIRGIFDQLKFRFPVIGSLYSKIVMSRFCRILSMLIKNGVPVIKSLEIAVNIIPNTYFKRAIAIARVRIIEGSSIFDGLEYAEIFPPFLTNLIAVGEKTGTLDEMLDFAVTQYDIDIKYTFRKLTAMIEPLVTCIVGVLLLLFALAVYLPIWDLSKVVTKVH